MNPSFSSYKEALDWIYSFSDTERTGQFVRDREDNLLRERMLLSELGNPQSTYGITHVAGTKGKGSTATMIAAILQAGGIRTGLYTQPDLHTFRERMRVAGRLIEKDELPLLTQMVGEALAHAGNSLGPYITYEVATALAFLYFREANADHAVIEVGLGGRLDATNVVAPMVTVITSISYDHMQVLGNTLSAIAGEKAGIIKPGVPVVTSVRSPEAFDVIRTISAERGAPLICTGPATDGDCAYCYQSLGEDSERSRFAITTPDGEYLELELALLGEHQLENATAAVAAAHELRELGLPISNDAIFQGLRNAHWPARLQVVGRRPWLVVDSAHNADSFARLFAALHRHFEFRRLILVLGLMADKDIPGITTEIKRAAVDETISTAWHNPRAASPDIAAALLEPAPVSAQPNLAAAMRLALSGTGPEDMVCVAGSVAFAGEALRWCKAHLEGTPAPGIEIAGLDH
ncbi:MAG: bifunctional folylpolyglutamate synthase/dihydrofolate synthase [Ktedonobacterales bacterium]